MNPPAPLSFIIPAYNAEATLPRTLASLQAQTRADWKAVIVDDGSNDATKAIARAAAAKDPRISWYGISHSGVSKARNFGLSKVDTEWVCFLDSDDWLQPAFSGAMLGAANSDLDLIYCGYQRVGFQDEVISIFSEEFLRRGFECAARECPTAIHSIIIRRSLVESLSGFDTSLLTCEDWDLWQRATRTGARIAAVPEFLAMYHMHDGGLSRRYPQVIADAHKVIKRGFSYDPRVSRPLEAAANGAHGDDESIRCSFFTAWCAAAEVGAGHDGAALLATYPCDFGGHIFELGKSLALALAIGAKRSISDLAVILPCLKAGYEDLLHTLAGNQRQVGVARGISYAVEREALRQLPSGRSVQLSLVAKVAIDLKAISGFKPAPGVDVLILDFLSHNRSQGQMEIAVFGPCSAGDVALSAMGFLGLRRFVGLCGLLWRPDYYVLASFLCAEAVCEALFRRLPKMPRKPMGIRASWLGALKRAAVRLASRGARPIHRQLIRKRPDLSALLERRPAGTDDPSVVHRATQGVAPSQSEYWDGFFAQPDPWNYGCDYEQTKYRRTLEILPPRALEKVLELACAEGIFTGQLARHAKSLVATDISEIALKRAREECHDCANTKFLRLDIVTGEIPGDQTLIVCSEVLYYVGRDRLPDIARKLRDALRIGGCLVTANAFVLKDDMSSTGFDWEQEYGAKVIHEALLATEGLALEKSIITDLYRIDCFKRCKGVKASLPQIRYLDLACKLEPSLTRQIVWDGAWQRRNDLIRLEQCWEVPILAYHRVAADGPASLRRWRVDPETFRKQLRLLRAHGYYSVASDDLLNARTAGKPLPGRPVLITFDDGYQDFADVAWPILEAEGFNAEVFIVTDRVGESASWDARNGETAPLMDWPIIEELHKKGVRFGSHLATHTPATNLSSHALLCEAIRSRADLETRLRTPVVSIAAPHGATDERYRRLLASVGYRLEFSGEGKKADLRRDCYGLPRLLIEGSWDMDDFAQAMEISPTAPSKRHEHPLVTVVVPAYNAARTIDETLRSARYQTYPNLEILVVDDGSADATAEIALKHAAIDKRVRVINQANGGVAAARNRGIAEAKSDLIAPLDADDLWAPTKIEKQLQAMSSGGEKVALVYTWFAVIDESGTVCDLEHRPLDAGPVLRRMCRGNLVGNGSSPLMRKSAIVEAGGFDAGLRSARAQGCEDLLLYFRIAERHDFAVVPEHLTGYRRHPDAMSEDSLQMLRSYRLVAKEMHQKYPQYRAEIRFGEANLADWLMRKALRKCRFGSAVTIFFHIARADLRFSLAAFLPGVLLRGGRKLVSQARSDSKPLGPLTFCIGSSTNLEASP